jgi:Transposase zinc-ribbon domain
MVRHAGQWGGYMLPEDMLQDFMEFNARFGTDGQCREYLFQARWPDGFRCDGCGQ